MSPPRDRRDARLIQWATRMQTVNIEPGYACSLSWYSIHPGPWTWPLSASVPCMTSWSCQDLCPWCLLQTPSYNTPLCFGYKSASRMQDCEKFPGSTQRQTHNQEKLRIFSGTESRWICLRCTEISWIARFLLKNRDYLKRMVIFTKNRPQSDPDKLKRIVRNSYLLLPSIIGKDWDKVE